MGLLNVDYQYNQLIKEILQKGTNKSDRTGTGTRSIFGHQMRFDLSEGFPLITTKKVFFKGIKGELLWFLSGSTSARELREKYGVTIWDEWEDKNGDLGPVYGKQWVDWKGMKERTVIGVTRSRYTDYTPFQVNQIQNALDILSNDPDSRRAVVSAWNVGDLENMALQPCHILFQFYTSEMNINERCNHWCASIGKSNHYAEDLSHKQLDALRVPKRKVSIHLYQRSCDVGLGLPFNIGSYALLLHMFANQLNMVPGELIMSFGDIHIYNNHLDILQQQVERQPKPLGRLYLNPDIKSIFDYKMDDIKLIKYNAHSAIKMDVSV